MAKCPLSWTAMFQIVSPARLNLAVILGPQMKLLSPFADRSVPGVVLCCFLALLATPGTPGLAAIIESLSPWSEDDSDLDDSDDSQAALSVGSSRSAERSRHKEAPPRSDHSRLNLDLQQPRSTSSSQLPAPVCEHDRLNGVGAHLRC